MKLDAIPKMLSMIPSTIKGVTLDDLERIKEITRLAFPTVPQLNTETLSVWMTEAKPPLLIDVRSPKEYAVSHLRGAVNLTSTSQIIKFLEQQELSRIVLYCSVGFRSSRLANLLAERGFPNLLNLEGSIFQWANEGREIYQGEVRVKQVHPYGRRWAGLLKDGLASGDQPF